MADQKCTKQSSLNRKDREKIFFIVPAKNKQNVFQKIRELETLGYRYLIVCGESINHPHIVYCPPKGKYDALNYGTKFIPHNAEVIAFNDADTEICNFHTLIPYFQSKDFTLIFTKVNVMKGP